MFLVKSVVNPLSYSFATFATDGITAFQIMPIFWQTVKYLERINLKVIVVIQVLMLFTAQKIFILKKYVLFTFLQMPHIWYKQFEIIFIIPGPDVGQDTCETMVFFFYGHI